MQVREELGAYDDRQWQRLSVANRARWIAYYGVKSYLMEREREQARREAEVKARL